MCAVDFERAKLVVELVCIAITCRTVQFCRQGRKEPGRVDGLHDESQEDHPMECPDAADAPRAPSARVERRQTHALGMDRLHPPDQILGVGELGEVGAQACKPRHHAPVQHRAKVQAEHDVGVEYVMRGHALGDRASDRDSGGDDQTPDHEIHPSEEKGDFFTKVSADVVGVHFAWPLQDGAQGEIAPRHVQVINGSFPVQREESGDDAEGFHDIDVEVK
mmetsp:Transcript_39128/g.118187  ORF Transcript_39128/g.118187 Transcript_39128/m.118187 type:complete len:220 (-) Transcript_39128:731-1390(-)